MMMLRMNRKEHFVAKVFLILPPPSSHPFFTLHTLQLRVAKNVAVRWKKSNSSSCLSFFFFPSFGGSSSGNWVGTAWVSFFPKKPQIALWAKASQAESTKPSQNQIDWALWSKIAQVPWISCSSGNGWLYLTWLDFCCCCSLVFPFLSFPSCPVKSLCANVALLASWAELPLAIKRQQIYWR